MSPQGRDANLDLIKWLAMLTMLLDHLRYLWPQAADWLFIIGRLAFPLFCLGIAANVARPRSGGGTPMTMFAIWAGWLRFR
ncbi:conserved protein of unknown function [Pseudomonas marincola]|uniref:TraX protein n=1 Tax=Pseudomonas marincola TaxID=437900 RepID=A0A653E0Z9_9PSED|nr:conserved protein of unknown function [Pseudomonas marincola]